MGDAEDLKFLALLVHRGLVAERDARAAIASGDPRRTLIERGVLTDEQWRSWQETDAGRRPALTRYELCDLLGEGGQACVFRARDRTTGDTVALKVLKPEHAAVVESANRFVMESKLLIELESDHIVKGLRVAKEGKALFCAMELVDGVCLQDRLEEFGRLDEEDALDIVAQVAEALAYMHGRGLVHRDVKPGNLMMTEDGRAVLIDLGFAVGGAREASETTAGTVHYISPEQARGQEGLDVRADIYSLGATLYHLVTGSLPFSGADSQAVLAKQVLESLSGEKIRALNLSARVHYFIEKMMAKEKEIRFQDPAELIDEVRSHLEQLRRERDDDERQSRLRSRRRRRRWL